MKIYLVKLTNFIYGDDTTFTAEPFLSKKKAQDFLYSAFQVAWDSLYEDGLVDTKDAPVDTDSTKVEWNSIDTVSYYCTESLYGVESTTFSEYGEIEEHMVDEDD